MWIVHTLSLARPLLGLWILLAITPSTRASAWALPAVLLACASDYLDGRLARRIGSTGGAGRLIDNLCDFFFLLFCFAAAARSDLWSPPIWGSAIRYWAGANWLPVIALLLSFGSYFLRVELERARGLESLRSPRGHAAGVANYALAIVAALEWTPGIDLGPWVLEPAFVTVALLNLTAVSENAVLVFLRGARGPMMRP